MKNKAIWKKDLKVEKVKSKMFDNMKTDVLIIGAGIAGLSTALNLINSNKKIVVIEKSTVGNGVTSASTGKITVMQGLCYSKIEQIINYETALKYYKSQKCATKLIDSIIKTYNIDCDYSISPSIIFTNSVTKIIDFEKEENFYEKAKIKYKKIAKLPNNYPCLYGLLIEKMHVFNPLKYLLELKKIIMENIPIYENTSALNISKSCGKYKIKTNKGVIYAKKVIVSTHYPFFITPGFIPLRTYIEKSYMLAAKVEKNYSFNAITASSPILSMRYLKDYMIIAANSHITKDTDNYQANFNDLKTQFITNFKGKIEYIWSNHDIMTNDNMPYIGEINTNLYVATGFNKWGITNGVLAGKILGDIILNKKNEYKDLFALNRKGSLTKTFNTFKHNFDTTKTYINMKLVKKKFNKVKIIKEDGKDISIYRDGKKEYKVHNKCPHMGCKLIFNEIDKTWDCPCHGSRFDINGNSIFGPSIYSIKV